MDDKEAAEKFADLQKEAKGKAADTVKTAARLKQIGAQLAAAAKDADALEIEAVASAIEGVIESIESRLSTAKLIVDDLRKLQEDHAFVVAHVADFRTLVHAVSELRKDLMKELDVAKKLAAEAKAQDDALRDSQDDALRELAEIESNMNAFKRFADRVKKSEEVLEGATEFVESRNRQGLEMEQRNAEHMSVKGAYPTLRKIEDRVAALVQKYRAKKFDDAAMKKILDQAKEILATGRTAHQQMDAIEANVAKVAELDIPDVDVSRAARSLHITDRAQIADLGKALAGDVYSAEKALDTLGAKLAPHQKGKAMLAQLRKDKVL
jgi:hypothetical protein